MRTALFATAAVVLTILLVAAPVLSLTPAERTSRVGRHGYETGLRALRTTAPSGLLVTNSDDLSAQAIFLLETERRRPDLLAVVKQFVCDPAAMSPLLRRADAATHPAARLLRTIHEHHCHGEDRRAVANAWQALANQGDPATSDLSWQLGDAMADHHFFHLLRPGYPTFSSAAGIRGFSPQAWQELLDSLPREPLSDHLAAFNDDISRQSLADFFLLAGTALLRTAPPGSPLLQGACGLMIRATRLGPSDCRSRNNLAICLAAAGDPARAVQVADLALPDCDDHLPLHLTALRYHLLLRQEAKATEVLAIMENAFPADMLVERVGRLARELEPHRGGSLSGWLMEWIESRLGIRPSELPVAVP